MSIFNGFNWYKSKNQINRYFPREFWVLLSSHSTDKKPEDGINVSMRYLIDVFDDWVTDNIEEACVFYRKDTAMLVSKIQLLFHKNLYYPVKVTYVNNTFKLGELDENNNHILITNDVHDYLNEILNDILVKKLKEYE